MVLCLSFFAVSCESVQQDKIIFSDADENSFLSFEERLVFLDAESLEGSTDAKLFEEKCRRFISDVEIQISGMGMNNAVLSRLYALEGRAYLLAGKTNKAKDCYKNSVKTFKGDAEAIILSYRLGME